MKQYSKHIAALGFFFFAGKFLIAQADAPVIDTVFEANGNPVIRHKFTADPAAMVYKDKVYLYTGRDQAPPKEARYVMHEWLCFSTPDMKTWTEHPSPLNVKAFSWAKRRCLGFAGD